MRHLTRGNYYSAAVVKLAPTLCVFEGAPFNSFEHTMTFSAIFFLNIHKKCIWYQFKIFSQNYARNKKERNFWPQCLQIAAFQQSFSKCWW